MPRAIDISKVVRDPEIFPRGSVDQEAVMRYRDAYELGEELPAIILEQGTNRLLDGWHRVAALEETGADKVRAEFHVIPDGVPALLYAAGLSSRHGVILSNREKSAIAVNVYAADGSTPFDLIAKQLAVHPNTIRTWLADIIREREDTQKRQLKVRRGAVALLLGSGQSVQSVADLFSVDHSQIVRDYKNVEAHKFDLLTDKAFAAEVLGALPSDVTDTARTLMKNWMDEQREELKARWNLAKIIEAWRNVETAAQYIAGWLESGAQLPEDATEDRIHYVLTNLETCITKLKEN